MPLFAAWHSQHAAGMKSVMPHIQMQVPHRNSGLLAQNISQSGTTIALFISCACVQLLMVAAGMKAVMPPEPDTDGKGKKPPKPKAGEPPPVQRTLDAWAGPHQVFVVEVRGLYAVLGVRCCWSLFVRLGWRCTVSIAMIGVQCCWSLFV